MASDYSLGASVIIYYLRTHPTGLGSVHSSCTTFSNTLQWVAQVQSLQMALKPPCERRASDAEGCNRRSTLRGSMEFPLLVHPEDWHHPARTLLWLIVETALSRPQALHTQSHQMAISCLPLLSPLSLDDMTRPGPDGPPALRQQSHMANLDTMTVFFLMAGNK